MENILDIEIKNKNHLPSRLVTEEDYDQNPPEEKATNYIKNSNQNILYITTYNVRTLSTYSRLLELTECFKNIWSRVAENREFWSSLEEAFTFHGEGSC